MAVMPRLVRAMLMASAQGAVCLTAAVYFMALREERRQWAAWAVVIIAAVACTAIAGFPRELAAERRVRGLSPRCGYDLTGNVSGVCPECGTALAAA